MARKLNFKQHDLSVDVGRRKAVGNLARLAGGIWFGGYALSFLGCEDDPVGPEPEPVPSVFETIDFPESVYAKKEELGLDGKVDFVVRATNEKGLNLLRVSRQGGFTGEAKGPGDSLELRVEDTFTEDDAGKQEYNAEAKDVFGEKTKKTFPLDVKVVEYFDVFLETKKYLSQKPNPGVRVEFVSRSFPGAENFVFVSDGNGLIQGRLPEGEYDVLLDGIPSVAGSHVSRMKIYESNSSDSGRFLQGLKHSFGVSGRRIASDNRFSYFTFTRDDWEPRLGVRRGGVHEDVWVEDFLLYKDFSSVVETVDSPVVLEELARQAHSYGLAVPRVDRPLFLVYNRGNEAYPRDWNFWDHGFSGADEFPDGGLNPPGIVSDELEGGVLMGEKYWDVYLDRMKEILNDERVGGNPYDVRDVRGFADELHDYVDWWRHDQNPGVLPVPGSVYVGHSRGTAVEWHAMDSRSIGVDGNINIGVWFVDRSLVFVGWGTPRAYSNENTFFGAVRESYPCVYSIRDRPSGKRDPPGCSLPPPPDLFSEKDVWFNLVLAGFGPYSQVQKRRGFPFGEGRGFNVWLLSPEYTDSLRRFD